MRIFKNVRNSFNVLSCVVCLCVIGARAEALSIKADSYDDLISQQATTINRAKQVSASSKTSYSEKNTDERRDAMHYALDIDQDIYVVNSGDVFSVRIWKQGLESSEYQAAVINGKIFLEMIGEIDVAGLSLRQAVEKISKNYAQRFKQFNVYVTLSYMRTYNVLVSGQVQNPGFYAATPMTRLMDIINMSGGILPTGSKRSARIADKDGKSTVFDILKFGDSGDTSQNPLIREHNSVFIPVRFGVATVKGDAIKPGECEIVEGDALYSLKDCFIDIAPQGHRGRILLKRPSASAISGEGRYTIVPLTWDGFNGETGRNTLLTDGDILEIGGPAESEFVIINGHVNSPGQYYFMKGMRVSDLLNSAGGMKIVNTEQDMIADTRLSARQASAASISGVYKLLINRVDRQSGEINTILIDLTSLLVLGDNEKDIELMPGDVLSVSANLDVVYVHGFVARPGFFPYDPSYTVRDFIFSAGGPARDGDIGRTKLTRDGSTRIVDLNKKLKPGDSIYVAADVKSSTKNNLSFISNLITFYLMIDRIWD